MSALLFVGTVGAPPEGTPYSTTNDGERNRHGLRSIAGVVTKVAPFARNTGCPLGTPLPPCQAPQMSQLNEARKAPGSTPFAARLIAVLCIAALAATLWLLSDLIILLFAGVVLAVALRALADVLARRLRVPERWSLLAAVILIVLVLSAAGWFAGEALVAQLAALRERVEAVPETLRGWLSSGPIGRQVLDLWNDAVNEGLPVARVVGAAQVTLTALGNLSLILIVAVYLAASPGLYVDGAIRLLPVPYRERGQRALDASAKGLRGWLKGQAVSMAFVGVTTAAGLALLGVPLALAVGLLSGLLAFIPFFGAIAGGALAVMVAFIDGPQMALYVALLAVGIQQIEGNLLMPYVQRRTVSLPPVLGIVAAVVFGSLFGLIGVFFATPLMTVAMILLRCLYVEDFLEQRPSPS
ncbi:MAG TPA: AI-2E family transporter [Rhizobacter sp.]